MIDEILGPSNKRRCLIGNKCRKSRSNHKSSRLMIRNNTCSDKSLALMMLTLHCLV